MTSAVNLRQLRSTVWKRFATIVRAGVVTPLKLQTGRIKEVATLL